MDYSNVKLIVSDMDGTLLNSKGLVSDEFFELFKALQQNDIHFVAASGRQHHSISHKLAPIKDHITIIAENGGFATRGNRELLLTPLELVSIRNIIPLLRKIDNVYTVLCGKKSAYIETKDQQFIDMFAEYYSNHELVDDLMAVDQDRFFKLAIYHFEDSEKYIYPHVKQLEDKLQIKISGKNWLDISHLNANKGFALESLQKELDISKKETMVFGDYNNDLEMLALADYSYAMQNAHENVKKTANYMTKSNDELGVETIIKKVVESKTNPLKP